jgi:hypothetical protein
MEQAEEEEEEHCVTQMVRARAIGAGMICDNEEEMEWGHGLQQPEVHEAMVQAMEEQAHGVHVLEGKKYEQKEPDGVEQGHGAHGEQLTQHGVHDVQAREEMLALLEEEDVHDGQQQHGVHCVHRDHGELYVGVAVVAHR